MCVGCEGNISLQDNTIDKGPPNKILWLHCPKGRRRFLRNQKGVPQNAAMKLSRVWNAEELSLSLKKHSVIRPCTPASNGPSIKMMINSFKDWLWGKILGVTLKDLITNEQIRRDNGIPEGRGLLNEGKRRKMAKYQHWKRRGESLIGATTEGEPPAKIKRGSRKKAMD